jgi:hypothetical protein
MIKRGRQRGVALVLVLMVTVIFLLFIGALLDVLAMEAHSAKSSAQSDAALTAAYAGVEAQILGIENFYINGVGGGQPPAVGQQIYLNQSGGDTATGYNASIANAYSDDSKGQKYFLIQSDGFLQNQDYPNQIIISRQVTALVQEGQFGQFPQFTNSEHSNTGGTVDYTSGQQFTGLVYSGGPMHIVYTPGQPAIFNGGFDTTVRPKWYNELNGDTKPPQPGSEAWAAVFGPGATYETGVTMDLPGLSQNLVVFSEAFLGNSDDDTLSAFQNATASLQPGVYLNGTTPPGGSGVPLNSGIFVQDSVDISSTSTSTPSTETFTLSAADGDGFPTTTITIDFTNNLTTVAEQGQPTTTYIGVASGTPTENSNGNGAIFVNGSANIADGSVVHGQYDLALPDPPTNDQAITVDGSILYLTKPDPQNNVTSTDELALWANDIKLDDLNSAPIEIDGMLLTGYVNECTTGNCADGSFFNQYCNARSCSGGMSDITLFGGLLENIRGKLGEENSQGQLAGGFLRNAAYDARLGANPPPFTPTTNAYSIVAVQDDGSL